MATTYHYFSGTAKWARVRTPDPKYGNYKLDLYVDAPTRKEIKAAGIRSQFKEDDEGFYITFRRPTAKLIKEEEVEFGPPKVIYEKDPDWDGLIGNGSKVTIKVSVYDTMQGKGSRLEAVRIDELVEYVSPNGSASATNDGLQGLPF